MKMDTAQFRVRPGEKVRLDKRATKVERFYKSKPHYRELLGQRMVELQELQDKLYAANSHSVLFILQAMDAAGKDGVIKHVMSGLNPQGCQVFSFKQPSSEELDHDFLWRAVRALPERGRIGIFNRSYYEEVLVVRVHPEILVKQGLPDAPKDLDRVWKGRYRSIADLEAHLQRNGTRVVKIYLHLSKAEQKKRFLARIDDPAKNWKFMRSDIEERGFWKDYAKAYEDCMAATSTKDSPWYVVPADDKQNARLIVSRVLLDTLAALKSAYPTVDAKQKRELAGFRRLLK
jgi:PPK2 family polyphosphate:nucleotide phosphotransferase